MQTHQFLSSFCSKTGFFCFCNFSRFGTHSWFQSSFYLLRCKKVIVNIATRRNPIITRSRSRALRNSVNMSTHPKSSDRFATTPTADLENLGAQLSKVLNKFNDLSMEMTAQRCVIDQLVAGSSSSVQQDLLPASQPEPEPLPLPYTQTSFPPHFINPPKEPFTYPTYGLPHTYTSNIQTNPLHPQIPPNYLPVSLNMPFEAQGPYYSCRHQIFGVISCLFFIFSFLFV
nr:uncharacterized protein LOC113723433 [Coffea arabica]